MIRLKEVSYVFPNGLAVIQNMNLDLGEKEYVAIMGRNGSGKSTLARLISGLLLPETGSVEVDGCLTSDPRQQKQLRKLVGMLLPSPDSQLIGNTVEEDVAFGPENLGLPSQEIKHRVDAALQLVSMEDYRLYPPNLLSGGQKQLVCIAGLLAMQPRYMVLDEPTSMLDPFLREQILGTITALHQSLGIGIILITHRLEEAINSERIYLLEQGKVVCAEKPGEIFQKTDLLKQAGVEPLEISVMVNRMNRDRLIIDPSVSDAEELVNEIWHSRPRT